jgi:hypothetical protein
MTPDERDAFRLLVTADGTRAVIAHAELVDSLGGEASATRAIDVSRSVRGHAGPRSVWRARPASHVHEKLRVERLDGLGLHGQLLRLRHSRHALSPILLVPLFT